MRTYCISQGTLLGVCDDLTRREIQKKEYICMADLVCCIAENDTAVYSTYTPIKKKKKKNLSSQVTVLFLHSYQQRV